jgi:hypothetical protein
MTINNMMMIIIRKKLYWQTVKKNRLANLS